LQEGVVALEERHVGQHAEGGRAVALVAGGDLGRHEALAQHALARTGLLDLGDNRGLAALEACAQGPDEVALPAQRFRLRAQGRELALRAGAANLFALDGDDALENVAHWSSRVRATNWCILASAQPEATA